MPAARQRSASPFSAEAVSATIGVRARCSRASSSRIARASCVAVELRHVHVGQHAARSGRYASAPGPARRPRPIRWRSRRARAGARSPCGWSGGRRRAAPGCVRARLRPASAAGAARSFAALALHAVRSARPLRGARGITTSKPHRGAHARRAVHRHLAAHQFGEAARRSRGPGRCRRSAAWCRPRPARTAGTGAPAARADTPMPVSVTRKQQSVAARCAGVRARTRATPAPPRTAPVVGELDRVGQEVAEDLPQPQRVGAVRRRRRARRSSHVSVRPLLDAEPVKFATVAAHHAPQVDRRGRQLQPPGLDLREVEDVADDLQQRLRPTAGSR